MCLAIPGQIQAVVDPERKLARVSIVGVQRIINVGLLDSDSAAVLPGEWVLVHVGFAISRIDEVEAAATLAFLEQLGPEYEQELTELRASSSQ